MEIALIESVRDNLNTLVEGCVSSGKTHATAGVVLWFMVAFAPSARVFSMAPTHRQLTINLWGEIARMHQNARYPLGGDLVTLKLTMGDNWFAMGFSPKDAMGVFGVHGENDLFIIDDAQGINPEIWTAIDNAKAGGTTRVLLSCNPIVTSGEIYEAIAHRKGGYNLISVTADKSDPRLGQPGVFLAPNVRAGRVVVPGTITQESVQLFTDKYGWDSDFVRTKVRCLLPKQEPDQLIPLDWLELATMREVPDLYLCSGCHTQFIGKEQADKHAKEKAHAVRLHYVLGVDVARFGDDSSAIVPRSGRRILKPITLQGNDTMQVSGRVVMIYRELNATLVNVDVIGIGSGVADRTREQGLNVYDVNVGESATDPKFARLRDEIWWCAREAFNPNNPNAMALPRDPNLIGDLSAPKWTTGSDGKIKVEGKDSMKKRLGRSPDEGDAACLAIYEGAGSRIQVTLI